MILSMGATGRGVPFGILRLANHASRFRLGSIRNRAPCGMIELPGPSVPCPGHDHWAAASFGSATTRAWSTCPLSSCARVISPGRFGTRADGPPQLLCSQNFTDGLVLHRLFVFETLR